MVAAMRLNASQRPACKRWRFGPALAGAVQGAYGMIRTAKRGNQNAVMKEAKQGLPIDALAALGVETDILRRCDHPNIVKYVDHEEVKGNPARVKRLFTEHCEGGDMWQTYHALRSALPAAALGAGGAAGANSSTVPPPGLLQFVLPDKSCILKTLQAANCPLLMSPEHFFKGTIAILSALVYLHSLGIVHCDLKLPNLVLKSQDDFSSLKLIDFGIAKKIGELLRHKWGTDGWMAPELYGLGLGPREGETIPVSTGLDMYAFGMIAVQLLTGQDSDTIWGWCVNGELKYRLCTYVKNMGLPLNAIGGQLVDVTCNCMEPDSEIRPSAQYALGVFQRAMEAAAAVAADAAAVAAGPMLSPQELFANAAAPADAAAVAAGPMLSPQELFANAAAPADAAAVAAGPMLSPADLFAASGAAANAAQQTTPDTLAVVADQAAQKPTEKKRRSRGCRGGRGRNSRQRAQKEAASTQRVEEEHIAATAAPSAELKEKTRRGCSGGPGLSGQGGNIAENASGEAHSHLPEAYDELVQRMAEERSGHAALTAQLRAALQRAEDRIAEANAELARLRGDVCVKAPAELRTVRISGDVQTYALVVKRGLAAEGGPSAASSPAGSSPAMRTPEIRTPEMRKSRKQSVRAAA